MKQDFKKVRFQIDETSGKFLCANIKSNKLNNTFCSQCMECLINNIQNRVDFFYYDSTNKIKKMVLIVANISGENTKFITFGHIKKFSAYVIVKLFKNYVSIIGNTKLAEATIHKCNIIHELYENEISIKNMSFDKLLEYSKQRWNDYIKTKKKSKKYITNELIKKENWLTLIKNDPILR